MMAMNNINTLYQSREFHITQANMYGKFEPIRAGLLSLGITLNTVSRDKHVPGLYVMLESPNTKSRVS